MDTQPPKLPPSNKSARKALIVNVAALCCGVWFLLTGWMWVYLANVIFSYPFAIVGVGLWWWGRKIAPPSLVGRFAGGFLAAGLIVSLAALFLYK